MDVHSSGDHVIVGGYDRKLCWFDLDLSEKPYKVLRFVQSNFQPAFSYRFKDTTRAPFGRCISIPHTRFSRLPPMMGLFKYSTQEFTTI